MPPGFQVLDENSTRGLIAEARQSVLTRAGRGDQRLSAAINQLVGESSEETLNRILAAALGNDRRKMDRFFAANEFIEDAVWRAHGADPGIDVPANFCSELKRDIAILKQARDWLASGTPTDAGNGALLADFLALEFLPAALMCCANIFSPRMANPAPSWPPKSLPMPIPHC